MAHEARSRAVTPRPQWGCGGWLTPRGGWLTHCGLTLLVGDRFRLVSITTRKQEQEQGQEWERQKKQHKISINTASICQHHFHGHQHLMLASVILLPLAPCQREPPSGGVSSLEAGIASTSECERCWMILDEFGLALWLRHSACLGSPGWVTLPWLGQKQESIAVLLAVSKLNLQKRSKKIQMM